MKLKDYLQDIVPIKRRRSTDWIVPAAGGLALGLVAGIGAGMLMAPESGDAMRFRLRRGAHLAKERAEDLARRARGQAAAAIEPQQRSS